MLTHDQTSQKLFSVPQFSSTYGRGGETLVQETDKDQVLPELFLWCPTCPLGGEKDGAGHHPFCDGLYVNFSGSFEIVPERSPLESGKGAPYLQVHQYLIFGFRIQDKRIALVLCQI